MALRALNSVVAANYNKLSTNPILAGDIVMIDTSDTTQNPAVVKRGTRDATYNSRGYFVGVCADDALGTNPAGETPTMINNDPAGSNFVNGSAFQSYTNGFYVGVKRAIGDFKDESIDVVTNLTAGIPTYPQRGVTVYTTPSSQFVTDRYALFESTTTTADGTTITAFVQGDLLTVSSASTNTASGATVNGAGKLVRLDPTAVTDGPVIGRVDYFDSGAGLLYWTLL